jgi:hypothetical protein
MRPIQNVDFSLLKRLSFTERYKLELGAQFMNLFNHPQFVGGNVSKIDAVGSDVGQSSGVRNYLTPDKNNFNRPEQTFSSNPRNIQISAKFIF